MALLLVVAAAASSLLYLSWPRLQASLIYLPVDTAIANYYASREIPSTQLGALIERAQQANARHAHYRYHDGLSILYFLRGMDQRSPTMARRPAYEKSIEEAEKSVAAAPAQPMTWQRIARTHAVLGEPAGRVIPALKMSIYAGRVEPTLLLGRLELGYHYLAALDPEARALVHDQTLLTWQLKPRELTQALREGRLALADLRQLLGAGDADILAEMEASLVRTVR